VTVAAAPSDELLPLLDDLAAAVEDLLLTGLTTASQATLDKIDVAFREASRRRLLRLSAALRVANEEIARFVGNAAGFSPRRLCFFLNRAWLLAHGMARAIRSRDGDELARLLWASEAAPVDGELRVATLGTLKKVVAGAFCSFEFRLRATRAAGAGATAIAAGDALIWSIVFPLRSGSEIPAEGFLQMPQKQKFVPHLFLEGQELVIRKAAVTAAGQAARRIVLGEESRVEAAGPFRDFARFRTWNPRGALERLGRYRPGPLDLEVEIQEEVVLGEWRVAGEPERRDDVAAYRIESGGAAFEAPVSTGIEGAALRQALGDSKAPAPPLYGLMHYERARLMLMPLACFGEDGMEHLMISKERIDRAALLKSLRF
jgi:hypothetical protein